MKKPYLNSASSLLSALAKSVSNPTALRCGVLLVVATVGLSRQASAASYTWDPGTGSGTAGVAVGGTGTWDAASTEWFNGAGDVAWPNDTTADPALTAAFAGSPGTVTVSGSLNVNSIALQSSGYLIQSGTLRFGGTTPFAIALSPGVSGTISSVLSSPGGSLSITGSGGSSGAGGGALTVSSSNSTIGAGTPVTITGAQFNFGNVNALGTAPIALNNSTAILTTAPTNSFTISGTSTINGAQTLNGSIGSSGTATLIATGGGRLTVGGSMTNFTGTVVLSGSGTIFRLNNTANNNLGSATAAWDLGTENGVLQNRNGGGLTYNLGALTGGSNTQLQGAQTGGSTSTSTWSIGALNTNSTFAGRITDGTNNTNTLTNSVSIVKTGSGTLTLTGTQNSYTGVTTIQGGGTLSVASLANGGILTTTVTTSGSNVVTVANASGLSVGQTVFSSVNVIPFGTTITAINGTNITLSNNALATGTSSSTAYATSASSLGVSSNAASNLVFNGGTLQYTGTSAASTDRLFTLGTNSGTIDAAAGSGALTFSNTGAIAINTANPGTARVLTLSGSNSAVNTFAPALTDNPTTGGTSSSLVKNGSATWVLTGTSNYTGNTTVNAGTLVVSGSLSGTRIVNVNNTGVLGGSGGFIGNSGSSTVVTINGGGTLAPHLSSATGSLTVGTGAVTGNSVVFSGSSGSNAVFGVNIDASTNASDLLTVNGTLDLSGGFDQLSITLLNGGSLRAQSYTLATFSGGYANMGAANVFDTIAGLPSGYGVVYNANSIVLQAVPEPGTWALALSGLGMLVVFQRRLRTRR